MSRRFLLLYTILCTEMFAGSPEKNLKKEIMILKREPGPYIIQATIRIFIGGLNF